MKGLVRRQMTVAINENDLKMVLEKLDNVHVELLRLRAMLLPEEEATAEEKKEIRIAEEELKKGSKVKLEELVKELGC